MFKLLTKARDNHKSCSFIFTSSLFVAFHYYIAVYLNSTFLSTIVPQFWIGIIYATGSFLTILLLINLSKFIENIGLYRTLVLITCADILSLFIILYGPTTMIIIIGFVIYVSIPPLLLTCLDTAIEDTADTTSIGKIRGIFLTILATAAVISPLVIGGIIHDKAYKNVYIFSLFFICLFFLSIWVNRKKFTGGTFSSIKGIESIKEFLSVPDIKRIGIANFALHFFFSWMIIYLPVYLGTEIGFSWADIGIMISITLLPFVLLEIPAGELADNTLGEKEILIGGMICMILAAMFFPTISSANFVSWTLIILFARTGASLAETMIESYFFKKSLGRDELIEVFRMTQPLAYILGPIFGSIALVFIPFRYIFPILSVVLLLSLLFVLRLRDTK